MGFRSWLRYEILQQPWKVRKGGECCFVLGRAIPQHPEWCGEGVERCRTLEPIEKHEKNMGPYTFGPKNFNRSWGPIAWGQTTCKKSWGPIAWGRKTHVNAYLLKLVPFRVRGSIMFDSTDIVLLAWDFGCLTESSIVELYGAKWYLSQRAFPWYSGSRFNSTDVVLSTWERDC